MPAEGVKLTANQNLLTTEEMLYLAKIFVKNGVNKIRLTGGEPTVRKDIVDIIAKLKEIPKLSNVGITTNGLVLTRLLVPMQRAGLDSINISLDTLNSKKYEEITRRKGWERVIAGIDLAIQLGYKPKINCVLMKNFNEDEICDFVAFTEDRKIDVRFIEYMPFSGNKWQTDNMVPFRRALNIIEQRWPDFYALENGKNDTSKAYKVPGYIGQVGFITSMTEHFCGTCNRLRLTADGNLKVCLFGNKEISLLEAIRSNMPEHDLISLISSAVQRKKKQHADNQNLTFFKCCSSFKTIFGNLTYLKFKTQFRSMDLNAIRFISSTPVNREKNEFQVIPNLSHVDSEGKAKMVDVSDKDSTQRIAEATATVFVGPVISKLIQENGILKGDVLSLAEIAGVLGAKKTSELIPLCHNIFLSVVQVKAEINPHNTNEITLYAIVKCHGKTGVEMEALTAVSIASLTIYDMCKAVSHEIEIKCIKLLSKSGGKRSYRKS
ncbi:molybdenum cofactor biosynthesis protein 1 isoform X2 [Condylostylus longicornis]|nr:molybdenum cofactor biosynthesis protein 1 isoform X2 [Condylostylus longicornis]